mgnify:CR=1 FL=1
MICYIVLFGLIIWGGAHLAGRAFAQRLIEEDEKSADQKR